MAPEKSSPYALLAPPTDGKTPNQHELVDDQGDPEHPANLIPTLCQNFYKLGWVTGTGGGISIRQGFVPSCTLRQQRSAPNDVAKRHPTQADPNTAHHHREKVYLAPSGVQKERIQPQDIFVLTLSTRSFLRWPVHKPLKQSACTPLFYNAYELRNAGACIHTHSQHAVMATLLWKGNEFRVSHQEMIKGMRISGTGSALSYLDTLIIPIIENTPDEEDLREGMEEDRSRANFPRYRLRNSLRTLLYCHLSQAMRKYPDAPAVLVRRHGTYSWGADWEKAKAQAECLDYLLEVAVKMKLAGMDTVGL
ncbi:BZ3500_MvSof-1268-A1-R1_Chr6-3g08753 [Microbotryum saponariae]|uniref:Methylthioribulose-1-phosphate dehydratase n=1 Tax=Microbotryum saponariae TaxID=289078 RepID=A0A2X0LJW2_9BASI|nr:BZ3500_MvSof-1268-A1-R1_Chr6-3g08753 [Microbotryum saponariae]SDA07354.1 BZ3501_MvSof-1269-A2-R1_Chr6-2g08456 [Microbotryum saponariae]